MTDLTITCIFFFLTRPDEQECGLSELPVITHKNAAHPVASCFWLRCFWLDRRDVHPPPTPPCPAGSRADGTVSGADVDNQASQSVFWPAAVHSSTYPHRGFGPEWDSPDNHPSPNSSCTTHNAAGLALQLGGGIPRGVMECCAVQRRCQSHSLQASMLLFCAHTPSDLQSLKAKFGFSILTFWFY